MKKKGLISEIERKKLEFDAEFERLLKEFTEEMRQYKSGVMFHMENRYNSTEKSRRIIGEMDVINFAKQAFADKAEKIAGGISFLQQVENDLSKND